MIIGMAHTVIHVAHTIFQMAHYYSYGSHYQSVNQFNESRLMKILRLQGGQYVIEKYNPTFQATIATSVEMYMYFQGL